MNQTRMLMLVEDLIIQRMGASLTDLQRSILTDCWLDPRVTYEIMANKHGYSAKYLKQDVGPKLWKLLSIICGEKVKKNNFKSAIERLVNNNHNQIEISLSNDSNSDNLAVCTSDLEITKIASPAQLLDVADSPKAKNKIINLREAPDANVFFGRQKEIDTLSQLLVQKSAKLVTILGMGGIGKTNLAIKLVQEVTHDYDYVFWRSLTYNASYEQFILELLTFLYQDSLVDIPTNSQEQLDILIDRLHQNRCLIILDNLETILSDNKTDSSYRAGYEKYGDLFQIIGQYNHRSCLLITSREKPQEINIKQYQKVHCYYLLGLDTNSGRQLLQSKGCIWNSEQHCDYLLTQYAGNPLALKIASSTIQYLFDGNISDFVQQETFILSGISTLLKQQIERLSLSCKTIIYWLAILVNPASLEDLKYHCYPKISNHDLIETLETLLCSGVIEKKDAAYRLQPIIQEYLIEQIVDICHQEILSEKVLFLNTHALTQVNSEEYVNAYQLEFILKPLIDKCLDSLSGKHNLASKLDKIIVQLQSFNSLNPGYAVGNIINLLCQLNIDLTRKDFSNLIIWQADFKKVNLHQVNFSGSDLSKSAFSEQLTNVLSLDFSPDGQLLASGDSSGQVSLWSINKRGLQQICFNHVGWVFSLAFSPNGQLLASGSSDRTVVIWNVKKNCLVRKLNGHGQRVRCVVFSPKGNILATSSSDHRIKLWCVTTGTCLQTLTEHDNHVWSLAFSPDGKTLASGSEDRTIKLWDVATGICIKSLTGHRRWIRSIAFHPQHNVLISAGGDSIIKIWDLDNDRCIKSLTGHTQRIRSVVFSSDGRTIASGSGDNTIRLWNYETGECERVLHGHNSRLTAVVFSPNGKMLASSGEDKSIRLWSISSGKLFQSWQGYSSWFQSLAFSPDGQKLVSGSENHKIELWDLSQNFPNSALTLEGHSGWVCQVAFSPQQDKIVSCSSDRTIKLWDSNTGECIKTFLGHSHWIRSVAFSPSGKMLVSAGGDNVIKFWNIEQPNSQQSLYGHQGWVWSVAFSPDEKMVVSGSEDKTICLWNVSEGKLEKILGGHTSWVQSVVFSPDGQTIASGSQDESIKIWDVKTGIYCQTIRNKRLLEDTNIKGIKGINSAQINTLKALGAKYD